LYNFVFILSLLLSLLCGEYRFSYIDFQKSEHYGCKKVMVIGHVAHFLNLEPSTVTQF